MQGGCNEQIMAPIVYQGKVIFISSHKSPKEKSHPWKMELSSIAETCKNPQKPRLSNRRFTINSQHYCMNINIHNNAHNFNIERVLPSYFWRFSGISLRFDSMALSVRKDTKGMPPAVNAMYLMINARLT